MKWLIVKLEFSPLSQLPICFKNAILRKGIIMVYASKSLRRVTLDSCHLSQFFDSPNALVANIFLLILTAVIKIGLTAWTFGMMVCSALSFNGLLLSDALF